MKGCRINVEVRFYCRLHEAKIDANPQNGWEQKAHRQEHI